MGCCSCVNKLFLFVLNFVVFAIGILVIALASVVINRGGEYQDLLFRGILTLPIWTLLVGIVITIIGFFGCWGAYKEDKCMLYTYASIVFVLFAVEITLGILVAVYPSEAKNHIKEAVGVAFEKYGTNDTALNKAIDSMQHELKCCGVDGYQDWINKFDTGKGVPVTCCINQDPSECSYGLSPKPADLFKQGCFDAIAEDLRGVTIALGAVAIVFALVQIFCICIACVLGGKRSAYI